MMQSKRLFIYETLRNATDWTDASLAHLKLCLEIMDVELNLRFFWNHRSVVHTALKIESLKSISFS